MADGREQAGPDAGGVAVTAPRDDGHAHPESFAGGGRSMVGKRVQGDIHATVQSEMVLALSGAGDQLDAINQGVEGRVAGGDAALEE